MTKKVIDFNRLPKQEYQKPVMEVRFEQLAKTALPMLVTLAGIVIEVRAVQGQYLQFTLYQRIAC